MDLNESDQWTSGYLTINDPTNSYFVLAGGIHNWSDGRGAVEVTDEEISVDDEFLPNNSVEDQGKLVFKYSDYLVYVPIRKSNAAQGDGKPWMEDDSTVIVQPGEVYFFWVPKLNEDGDGNVLTEKESIAYKLKNTIAKWYVALRKIVLVLLLTVLLYIGIQIVLKSTSAQDKAKYKNMLKDWFVAICILFILHYLMAFMLESIDILNNIIIGNVIDTDMELNEKDKLISTLRSKYTAEEGHDNLTTTAIAGYTIMYLSLVILTVVFTLQYAKRVVFMAFLTIMAPMIALTYPLDKIKDGKAQAFNFWLREYIYNCLIQPVHLLLYAIFITNTLDLAGDANWLYAIVTLGFMIPAEKYIKEMFGLKAQSASNTITAAAGGAMVMNVVSKLGRSIKGDKGKSGNTSSPSGIRTAGKATETGGKAVETSGKAVETGGKAAEAGGKVVEGSGKAIDAGGNAIKAGSAIPYLGPVLGVLGTGVSVVGKGVQATGKGIQVAGKGAQTAGKGMKSAGKAVKNTGKNIKDSAQSSKEKNKETNSSKNTTKNNKEQTNSKEKKTLKKPSIIGGVGSMARRYVPSIAGKSVGILGGIAGATIGLAAGVAGGDLGKTATYVAGGASVGYAGGRNLTHNTLNGIKNMPNAISGIKNTWNEGYLGTEAYNNKLFDEKVYKSEEYKMMKEDNELIKQYGGPNGIKAATQGFLDNGITDLTKIRKALQAGVDGDSYKKYSKGGISDPKDMAKLANAGIDVESYKIFSDMGIKDANKIINAQKALGKGRDASTVAALAKLAQIAPKDKEKFKEFATNMNIGGKPITGLEADEIFSNLINLS